MDWNNDGKLDLLAGDTRGQVWLYLNTGTPRDPNLAAGVRVKAHGHPITGRPVPITEGSEEMIVPKSYMGYYSKIHWADYDNDSLKDLLVGQTCNRCEHIVFYKNAGTADKPKLRVPKIIRLPAEMKRPSPYLADLDQDGLKDMICGTDRKEILFFKNSGTAEKPKWDKPVQLDLKGDGFENGYRRRLTVTDWNEDGKLDLLMGDRYRVDGNNQGGNLWLFLGK